MSRTHQDPTPREAPCERAPRGDRDARANTVCCMLALALVSFAPSGCGAGEDAAPESRRLRDSCASLDEQLRPITAALETPEVQELADVTGRWSSELRGQRVEVTLALIVRLLRDVPQDLLAQLDGDELAELVSPIETAAPPLLRYLASPTGGDDGVTLIRQGIAECPRGTFSPVIQDLVNEPGLLDALVATLQDEETLALLLDVPLGDGGRDGFRALIQALLNAIEAPSFDVDSVIALLGAVVDVEEPPVSELLPPLSELLRGESLDNLRTALDCLRSQSYPSASGEQRTADAIVADLLYDLLSNPELGAASLIELLASAAPSLDDPALRGLLDAVLEPLLEAENAQRARVEELLLFFLRDDNRAGVLEGFAVLAERGALTELVVAIDWLLNSCPRETGSGR